MTLITLLLKIDLVVLIALFIYMVIEQNKRLAQLKRTQVMFDDLHKKLFIGNQEAAQANKKSKEAKE